MQRYLCDVIKTFHFPVFEKKKKKKKKKKKGMRTWSTTRRIRKHPKKGGKLQLLVAHARTQGNLLPCHVTNVTTGE